MNEELELDVFVEAKNVVKALDLSEFFSFGFAFAKASPNKYVFCIPFTAECADEIETFITLLK
jgi:hypothetical protein